jgi:hypothetical protein
MAVVISTLYETIRVKDKQRGMSSVLSEISNFRTGSH